MELFLLSGFEVLLTQIHFSSRVQFVELVVFQVINKQDAFSC